MSQFQWVRRSLPLLVLAALGFAPFAFADDLVEFATGGYASGLRTMDEMHMIDTDHDGTISRAEWIAYQEKIWATFKKDKNGDVDEKAFTTPSSTMATFATGGYARGLQTPEMMHKIDTNGDGKVSHDEYIAYQTKIYDHMDKNQTGSIGPQEFLGK
jgi:Ca2+-binding EF-hand superfamily protein